MRNIRQAEYFYVLFFSFCLLVFLHCIWSPVYPLHISAILLLQLQLNFSVCLTHLALFLPICPHVFPVLNYSFLISVTSFPSHPVFLSLSMCLSSCIYLSVYRTLLTIHVIDSAALLLNGIWFISKKQSIGCNYNKTFKYIFTSSHFPLSLILFSCLSLYLFVSSRT